MQKHGAEPMNEHLDTNRQLWNAWTALHELSDFYDLPGFKAGKSSLRPIERAELTDVAGRSLLHLQCHFGLDTLSWARQGAVVTGVDFSDQSIALAQALSTELAIPASFVCADIERLPGVLSGQFEIVFSSYGVLPWLRDLQRWAEVIAHFLRCGRSFRACSAGTMACGASASRPSSRCSSPCRCASPSIAMTDHVVI